MTSESNYEHVQQKEIEFDTLCPQLKQQMEGMQPDIFVALNRLTAVYNGQDNLCEAEKLSLLVYNPSFQTAWDLIYKYAVKLCAYKKMPKQSESPNTKIFDKDNYIVYNFALTLERLCCYCYRNDQHTFANLLYAHLKSLVMFLNFPHDHGYAVSLAVSTIVAVHKNPSNITTQAVKTLRVLATAPNYCKDAEIVQWYVIGLTYSAFGKNVSQYKKIADKVKKLASSEHFCTNLNINKWYSIILFNLYFIMPKQQRAETLAELKELATNPAFAKDEEIAKNYRIALNN